MLLELNRPQHLSSPLFKSLCLTIPCHCHYFVNNNVIIMSIWHCHYCVNSSLVDFTADACFSIYEKFLFVCLLYGLIQLHWGQSLTNKVLFWEFLFGHRRPAKAFVSVRDSALLLHMKYLFRGVCLHLCKLSITAQWSSSKGILLLSAAEGTCPGRTKEHLLPHSNDDIEWQYFLHNLMQKLWCRCCGSGRKCQLQLDVLCREVRLSFNMPVRFWLITLCL